MENHLLILELTNGELAALLAAAQVLTERCVNDPDLMNAIEKLWASMECAE